MGFSRKRLWEGRAEKQYGQLIPVDENRVVTVGEGEIISFQNRNCKSSTRRDMQTIISLFLTKNQSLSLQEMPSG